jgi:hypothetical protein
VDCNDQEHRTDRERETSYRMQDFRLRRSYSGHCERDAGDEEKNETNFGHSDPVVARDREWVHAASLAHAMLDVQPISIRKTTKVEFNDRVPDAHGAPVWQELAGCSAA